MVVQAEVPETIIRRPHHNKGRKFGRPFKKGQLSLSKGRNKKAYSLTGLLREELAHIPTLEDDGFDGKGKTNAYWVTRKCVEAARDGDRQAIKDIFDRLDGRPATIISGPGGGPIETRQEVKVIEPSDLKPALMALVECGAIDINMN